MRHIALFTIAAATMLAIAGFTGSTMAQRTYAENRAYLPDFSHGTTGILGPLFWSRGGDLGEDARFSDAQGLPSRDGTYLWCYGFRYAANPARTPNAGFARNNFVSRDPNTAYAIQPAHFLLHTTAAENACIYMGYLRNDFRFQHGDNCDLGHLAGGPRVCVLLPVRHDRDIADTLDQRNYYVHTGYTPQTFCVIEFDSGDMIHTSMFEDPQHLDARILLDLGPYFSGEQRLYPGVMKPIIRFAIEGGGHWKLEIERDGRDGLAGGAVDGGYDLVFTDKSPGAKPYTVDIGPENSAWAMSVFPAGGPRPAETSEVLVGLQPYDRRTSTALPWGRHAARLRDVQLTDLPATLARLREAGE